MAQERPRPGDRPPEAGAYRLGVDQGRPDGRVLPRRRPGDQIRDPARRTPRSAPPRNADPGRPRRHDRAGAGVSGIVGPDRRAARRLADPAGHRHRLRARDLRPGGTRPAAVAAGVPAHPRHRRRPGRHRPDRAAVQRGGGLVAPDRRRGPDGGHGRRRASRPAHGADLEPGLRGRVVAHGAGGPQHVADRRGLRGHRARRAAPRHRPEPPQGGDARPAPLQRLPGPAPVRLRQGRRLVRRPVDRPDAVAPGAGHRAGPLPGQAGGSPGRSLAGLGPAHRGAAHGRHLAPALRRVDPVRGRLHHEPVHRRPGLPGRRGSAGAGRGEAGGSRRVDPVGRVGGRASLAARGRRPAVRRPPNRRLPPPEQKSRGRGRVRPARWAQSRKLGSIRSSFRSSAGQARPSARRFIPGPFVWVSTFSATPWGGL